MPVPSALKMVEKATEKREEQKLWDLWLALYPDMIIPRPMAKGPALKFESFERFSSRLKAPTVSARSAEEILAEAEEIHRRIAESKEEDVSP
ncbi:hypothetical protein L1N85_11425 [Paenibacillus alkaliterrae]|uniref:hypothetical protein n=1 Tax=Paenibacillus alkaliterrae TaxID=320909 RepID=UPI001F3CEB1B|nr:hypothetical protein [Paenibacillus alkaliterrae]MCF2939047.1 hypothetical protein [Paenibacillus alkaliterrae]